MADLYILGKVSKEKNPYFDNDYWFYVGRVENGDDEDYVSLRKGTNALESAMFLWDIIDPQVRANYKNFRKNEIEVEENHLESGGYLVSVEQAKKLLEFIDDIDNKVEKFVDADGRILPEYLDYIRQRIYVPTLENGELDRDSLVNDFERTYLVKGFLREAVKLNYPLAID